MPEKKDYPILMNTDFTRCISANLRSLTRMIDAIYRKHLKPFKITESQLNILSVISQFWKIEQSRISQILNLERSTVSRDLKRLIERGYILQEGRVNKLHLSITDKGAVFMEEVVPAWNTAMSESKKKLGESRLNALNELIAAK